MVLLTCRVKIVAQSDQELGGALIRPDMGPQSMSRTSLGTSSDALLGQDS